MTKVIVLNGHRKGAGGILIREFNSKIRGEEIPHLVNREVLLEGETKSRVYAAQYIQLVK